LNFFSALYVMCFVLTVFIAPAGVLSTFYNPWRLVGDLADIKLRSYNFKIFYKTKVLTNIFS